MAGVMSFHALFSISVLLHPDWRLGQDLMSELGVSHPHAWLFNLSVMIMGALGAVFAVSLLGFLESSVLGRASVAFLGLGCASLFLLGVFTMEQRALHDALAWSFFILTVVGLMFMALPMCRRWKDARWAVAVTLATVSFSLTSLVMIGLKVMKHHLAEVLVVYALGTWMLAMSVFMLKWRRGKGLSLTPCNDS